MKFDQVLDACVLREDCVYAIEGHDGRLVFEMCQSGWPLPAGRIRAQIRPVSTADKMGWYVIKPGVFALLSNGLWFDEELQPLVGDAEPIARVV